MITLKAITKKNQSTVNKAIKVLIKYNDVNDLKDKAYNNDDFKLVDRLDLKLEYIYTDYTDICLDLPKNQIKQIENLNIY
jgi:hypothetical protein